MIFCDVGSTQPFCTKKETITAKRFETRMAGYCVSSLECSGHNLKKYKTRLFQQRLARTGNYSVLYGGLTPSDQGRQVNLIVQRAFRDIKNMVTTQLFVLIFVLDQAVESLLFRVICSKSD